MQHTLRHSGVHGGEQRWRTLYLNAVESYQYNTYILNPLVPEIFFCEFFEENLAARSYWVQNKVRIT